MNTIKKIIEANKPESRGLVKYINIPKGSDISLENRFDKSIKQVEELKNQLSSWHPESLEIEEKLGDASYNLRKNLDTQEKTQRMIDYLNEQVSIIDSDKFPEKISVIKTRLAQLEIALQEQKINEETLQKEFDVINKRNIDFQKVYKKIEKEYEDAVKEVEECKKEGAVFSQKDIDEAIALVEKVIKEIDYKEYRLSGQTQTDYVFMLIHPQEFDGDVNVL